MATAAVLALGVFGVSAASAATLTVCESGPPKCGYSSIQEAVNAASSGDEINVAAGTYNSGGELSIGKNLTLQGAGPERTLITGGFVLVTASVTIREVTVAHTEDIENLCRSTASGCPHLTLENSVVKNNSFTLGGGILNEFGTVTLSNTKVSENTAEGLGGGIVSIGGTVTLSNSTVSGNSANRGGGIWTGNGCTVTLSNSTVSDNTATAGGPGLFPIGEGGGIFFNNFDGATTALLRNSTVSGNSAEFGGGIYIEPNNTVTLGNTKVIENKATVEGGGIFNKTTLAGNNDTITGNTAPVGPGIFNESPGKTNLTHSEIQP
jgi:hypothetical protein